jgi:hypothetical protein
MKEKQPMRYVSETFIFEDKKVETLFDRTGTLVGEEDQKKVPHYAKTVFNDNTDSTLYYIKTHMGSPIDPMGTYGRRERNLETKMKKVSKNTFDLYLTYLKTNNSIYFIKAQRGFLND